MTSLSQRLELLGYPRVPALSSVSGAEAAAPHAEIVHCLCWLEDRHVRQLAIAARAPLRRASPADAWHAAFAEYLGAAGWRGAGSYAPARVPEALRWLAGHAIALEYEERAAEINAGAAAALAGEDVGAGAVPAPAPAVAADDAAIVALVRELAAAVHVPVEAGDDVLRTLQAVHRALRLRVLPALAAAGGAPAAAKARGGSLAARRRAAGDAAESPAPAAPGLASFPAGLYTGDAELDAATAVLRMLFVADLRELQDGVNEVIATIQEFTANPVTDSSLGQVGR
jgi:RLL motif-containing protein 1